LLTPFRFKLLYRSLGSNW